MLGPRRSCVNLPLIAICFTDQGDAIASPR